MLKMLQQRRATDVDEFWNEYLILSGHGAFLDFGILRVGKIKYSIRFPKSTLKSKSKNNESTMSEKFTRQAQLI